MKLAEALTSLTTRECSQISTGKPTTGQICVKECNTFDSLATKTLKQIIERIMVTTDRTGSIDSLKLTYIYVQLLVA